MVACDPESATAVTGCPSTVTSRYKMVPTAPCVPTSGVGFAPFCLSSTRAALALGRLHTAKVGNAYCTIVWKGGSKELIISAQSYLTFAADGRMATVPVFIQPDSEVLCLLGMNVLPALGVTFLRANSESLQTSESLLHNPTTAQVHLVRMSCVPTQKGAFLEAVPDQPLQGCCDLVFEPAQEALEPFGIRAPEALLSLHPCGHVWIPVQNPYMVSAWLSPSTRLGCVTVLPKIVELILS